MPNHLLDHLATIDRLLRREGVTLGLSASAHRRLRETQTAFDRLPANIRAGLGLTYLCPPRAHVARELYEVTAGLLADRRRFLQQVDDLTRLPGIYETNDKEQINDEDTIRAESIN